MFWDAGWSLFAGRNGSSCSGKALAQLAARPACMGHALHVHDFSSGSCYLQIHPTALTFSCRCLPAWEVALSGPLPTALREAKKVRCAALCSVSSLLLVASVVAHTPVNRVLKTPPQGYSHRTSAWGDGSSSKPEECSLVPFFSALFYLIYLSCQQLVDCGGKLGIFLKV